MKVEPLLLTAPDQQGSTPLHHASVQHDLECFHTLLNFKILKTSTCPELDINALNHYNRSPLHCAAAYGNLEAVETLLQCGAQIDIRDRNGKTPLDYARELKSNTRKKMLQLFLGKQVVLPISKHYWEWVGGGGGGGSGCSLRIVQSSYSPVPREYGIY